MNLDTVVGIGVVVVILFAAKLIDKPRRGKKKDKYLTRIEDEFKRSLNKFANKKIERMNVHYGLNIKLVKLTTELNFVEANEK